MRTTLTAEGSDTQDAQPSSEERQRLTGSDFKRKASYVHFNVFYEKENTDKDTIIISEIGLWAAAPRLSTQLQTGDTSTVSPGGIKYTRFSTKYPRVVQLYGMYSNAWWRFSRHKEENFSEQKLKGLLQYNGISHVSVELTDIYRTSVDPAGINNEDNRDRYQSNYIGARATFDSGHRTYFLGEASLYDINYNSGQSDFRNRQDTKFSGYVFYRLLPKTAVFAQADHITVDYSDGFDSRHLRYYAGLRWEKSTFTDGSVKVGLEHKNFSDTSEDDARNLSLELLLKHRFDSKKETSLSARLLNEESSINFSSYSRTWIIRGEYNQLLRGSLSGSVSFSYSNYTYFGRGDKVREDHITVGAIEASYIFNRWLSASAGYNRLQRDSDKKEFDYINNTFFVQLQAGI
jgi:hypothetical protein